jgi:Rieske Fe-S protein
MTTGTAAAMIITDTILGMDNSWTEVYDPSRSKPVVPLSIRKEASGLAHRQGAVIEKGGEKVAAYRDPQGVLHTLNPSCRHMGCLIPGTMPKRHGIARATVPAIMPWEK